MILTRIGWWAGSRPEAPRVAGWCCAAVCLGSGGGVGDACFAVADGGVLAGERLELGGEVAGAAVFVDPGFVIPGPEVAECGVRVRQQVVDDGQYRLAGGDDRFLLAPASGQAQVAVCRGRCRRTGRLVGLRAELRPRCQMCDRWNRVMSTPVSAISADDTAALARASVDCALVDNQQFEYSRWRAHALSRFVGPTRCRIRPTPKEHRP
jgi:hypothetical protein